MNDALRGSIANRLTWAAIDAHKMKKIADLKSLLIPFEVDEVALLQAFQKRPTLFSQSPATLSANIIQSANLVGIAVEQFVKAALRHPQLFYQSPETLKHNVYQSAILLGVPYEQFAVTAAKYPPLLSCSANTLNDNVRRAVNLMSLDRAQFVKAALKNPQLFCQRPETLAQNVETSSELMCIPRMSFAAAALRHPPLFSQKPHTLNAKVAYLHAIQEARSEQPSIIPILQSNPSALSYSKQRLHARYIIAKLGLRHSALSSLLTMSNQDACKLIVEHFSFSGTGSRAIQNLRTMGVLEESVVVCKKP